ncbi:MAG: hypothetical protein LBJ64_08230 [Deltaproteobacteria bacterium]|jgi:hypothetical protein|nr:hypothetical protein [Deltaproteobacteria bacterium]
MGNVLETKPFIRKIWAILANYIIGYGLEHTIHELMRLPLSSNDLPSLKAIFMTDVSPACHLLLRYDPFKFDSYWFEFTEESITEFINSKKEHMLGKLGTKLSFLLNRRIYLDSWNELEHGLMDRMRMTDH